MNANPSKKINLTYFLILMVIAIILCGWFNRYPLISYATRYPMTAKVVRKLIPKSGNMPSSSFIKSHNDQIIDSGLDLVIDVSTRYGRIKKFWGAIGMDSFNDGIMAPINQACIDSLVALNKNSAGSFRYIRTCGIYADRKTATKEEIGARVVTRGADGKMIYNWRIVDAVCDELLANNLKPIIALTYMPDELASIETHRNPWNLANISPPRDYEEWRQLIYETVRHLVMRYGENVISEWYFEVWNEPDYPELFWVAHTDEKYRQRGNNTEYFKLYDYAVAGALAAQENIRIGGPAIAGDMELFIKPFLQHCISGINHATGERGTRLDFISRHHYSELDARILPLYYNFINLIKSNSPAKGKQYEIILSEIGPSTQPQEWLNTQYVAAWIIKSIDGFYYLNDRFGSEYLPDITCFWTKPVPFNFNNHFGLMVALGDKWLPDAKRVVKRPAFNAFDMLSYLDGDRLRISGADYGDLIHGIASIDDEGDIVIIIYHLDERDKTNAKRNSYDIVIELTNLSSSRYRVLEYKIDEEHGNGYRAWQNSGSPVEITEDDLMNLKRASGLRAASINEAVDVTGGTLSLTVNMNNNSVLMLRLERL